MSETSTLGNFLVKRSFYFDGNTDIIWKNTHKHTYIYTYTHTDAHTKEHLFSHNLVDISLVD